MQQERYLLVDQGTKFGVGLLLLAHLRLPLTQDNQKKELDRALNKKKVRTNSAS